MTEEPQEEAEITTAIELMQRIRPLLAGQPPGVVGAALADLTAMLIAGHMVSGSVRQTKQMREQIFKAHMQAVAALIPVNEQQIRERMAAENKETRQ